MSGDFQPRQQRRRNRSTASKQELVKMKCLPLFFYEIIVVQLRNSDFWANRKCCAVSNRRRSQTAKLCLSSVFFFCLLLPLPFQSRVRMGILTLPETWALPVDMLNSHRTKYIKVVAIGMNDRRVARPNSGPGHRETRRCKTRTKSGIGGERREFATHVCKD